MRWLLLALTSVLSISSAQTPGTAVDASTVKVGAPSAITELDLGKLKGALRQLAWSRDGNELYIQTADGPEASEKLRHYIVPIAGGAPKSVDSEPEWAADYWGFKSDRFAPGLRSLMIEVEQKQEKTKVGTGSGRPGEQASGSPGTTPVDIEKVAEGQYQTLARRATEERINAAGNNSGELLNWITVAGAVGKTKPLFLEGDEGNGYAVWKFE